MAYFSNGTEGMEYQARYCNRCVHDLQQQCPIWALHLSYNYDQHDKDGKRSGITHDFLERLIPMDGVWAAECSFFHEATEEEIRAAKEIQNRLRGIDKPADWMAEWMKKVTIA